MSAANVSTFWTLPFAQLRRNRLFYLYYDTFYGIASVLTIVALLLMGHRGIYGEGALIHHFAWWHLAFLPLVAYVIVLGHVFAHVCTHGSLPRPLNRIVGEICGIIVLTRFASWEVVHQRHHRYSDDPQNDPHPALPSYLKHFKLTVVNVEKQLMATYFELYGDTPETRAFERRRAYVSYATNLLLIGAWFTLLGPIAFFAFFVPASIYGAFHLIHFNWCTHNAVSPEMDYKPVNLNHGLYKLGNKLCFGIYMHANHHKWPTVLNPATCKNSLPVHPAPTRESLAAWRALKKRVA
ncbi:MAG: fatty acid desaturase [Polyangiaceae bacterium]